MQFIKKVTKLFASEINTDMEARTAVKWVTGNSLESLGGSVAFISL